MFTWLGPGRMRQIVSAARNSCSVSQRRSSTMTRSAHAESPPPRLAIAILRKERNSAWRATVTSARGAGGAAPAGDGSLMDEVRVVRQLVRVLVGLVQRIRDLPAMRAVPVPIEHFDQPLQDRRIVDDDPELPPEVERAAIDVHRADQRAAAVGDQELGVELGMLLAVHLDTESVEDAQGRERVGDVGVADAVLAPAQH